VAPILTRPRAEIPNGIARCNKRSKTAGAYDEIAFVTPPAWYYMPQQAPSQTGQSPLYDSASRYGWVSIVLHWATAIVIIVLWFAGKSILTAEPDNIDAQRALHVSIAASGWLLILGRILWRFRSGHPHVRGQSKRIHRIAKFAHYFMLISVMLMLLSGPMLVWSGGHAVNIFNWVSVPGPINESAAVHNMAWFVHSNTAVLLLVLVLVHIGGALKHLMFHADDTIARMIWPGKRETDTHRSQISDPP